MKITNISIDDLKKKVENKEIEIGLYDGENKSNQRVVVIVDVDKIAVHTTQSNGWDRINIYEYDRENNTWVEEETYEREE